MLGGGVAGKPEPDGSGGEADGSGDPERPAPAVVGDDVRDERGRDAGSGADSGEDDAVGDAPFMGGEPDGDEAVAGGVDDGFADAEEIAAGTDPLDPNSNPLQRPSALPVAAPPYLRYFNAGSWPACQEVRKQFPNRLQSRTTR